MSHAVGFPFFFCLGELNSPGPKVLLPQNACTLRGAPLVAHSSAHAGSFHFFPAFSSSSASACRRYNSAWASSTSSCKLMSAHSTVTWLP